MRCGMVIPSSRAASSTSISCCPALPSHFIGIPWARPPHVCATARPCDAGDISSVAHPACHRNSPYPPLLPQCTPNRRLSHDRSRRLSAVFCRSSACPISAGISILVLQYIATHCSRHGLSLCCSAFSASHSTATISFYICGC